MKKNENNAKKERNGVFIALAICVLSIGIASLGTYNSVSSYLQEQNSNSVEDDTSYQEDTSTNDDSDDYFSTDESKLTQSDNDTTESKDESSEDDNSVGSSTFVSDKDTSEKDDETATETNTEVEIPSYTLSSTYSLPVDSITILQGFSGDTLVYNETMKDYRTHNGVDIAASVSETVYAVNNGLVLDTFYDLLLGNVVSIEHGDYEVWYCGLGSTFLVDTGEIIDKGTAIGSIKEVPFEASEDSHIHIEVRVDGELIDPLSIDFF